jgi:hypothetical protein
VSLASPRTLAASDFAVHVPLWMRDSPSDLKLLLRGYRSTRYTASIASAQQVVDHVGRFCIRGHARFWKRSRDAVDVYFHPASSATSSGRLPARRPSKLDVYGAHSTVVFSRFLVASLARCSRAIHDRSWATTRATPRNRLRLPVSDVSAAFGCPFGILWVCVVTSQLRVCDVSVFFAAAEGSDRSSR